MENDGELCRLTSISGTKSCKTVWSQGPKVSYLRHQDWAGQSCTKVKGGWLCGSEELCNTAMICHGMNLTHAVTMTSIIHWE